MTELAEGPTRSVQTLNWARWNLGLQSLRSSIPRYGFSVVCVAVALGLALACQRYGFLEVATPLFDVAIALTAWFVGIGPSVVAVVVSSACFTYFFTPPLYTVEISSGDLPYFFVFVAWAVIVGSFVTVRRRIENDLRRARDDLQVEVEHQTRQAHLLDLTHDSIIVRDINGVIAYWNRGAEEVYGWQSDEVIGKVTHSLLQTSFPEPLAAINHQLLVAGRWEGELLHTTRDGSRVCVASRWSLQRNDQGQPTGILETNDDITERKRHEDDIRRLNQELGVRAAELEASNKELEAFAYSVSHDLRAPLRHVVGYSELLQKHASALLDDKSRRYMQTIFDVATRMGNLIDDLLSFSRIGRAETRKTLVNLEQLAREVVMESGQDAKGRDIAWKIGALPVCYGDRSMLRLVVGNLVANAVKFTRTRKPAEIEIGCTEGNNEEIEVFVRDNGTGFDMQYVDKLFGVFQRLHLAEEFEGTGIGLAIVQRIIHRHGGKVRAEGAIDRGATFYFSLPKAQYAAERRADRS
jgi:PAS domain S-box-containing protein